MRHGVDIADFLGFAHFARGRGRAQILDADAGPTFMRDARLGPFCRCRAVSVTASGRADFGALNPLSLHERKRELDLGRSRVASGKFVGLLEAVEAVGDGLWLDAAFTGVQELEELVVQQDRHELVEEIAEMGDLDKVSRKTENLLHLSSL